MDSVGWYPHICKCEYHPCLHISANIRLKEKWWTVDGYRSRGGRWVGNCFQTMFTKEDGSALGQEKEDMNSPPTKFRTQSASGKSNDNNFGDSEELHMVDYLPSKKTIIGQYYVEIMFKLCDSISQKRRGKLSLSVCLLYDNEPVHRSLVAQQAVRDCGRLQLNLTVQIWLLMTVICWEIWNIIFMVPVYRRWIAKSCCWSMV